MLIVCPSCASSYKIPDEKLGANGRTVRCKRCATTWFAKPEAEEPAADAAEIDPFAAAVASIDRAADSADEIMARATGDFVAPAPADAPPDESPIANPEESDAFAKLDAPKVDMERVAAEIDGEVVAASARSPDEPETPAAEDAPPARRSVLARLLAAPAAAIGALAGLAGRFRRAPAVEAEPVDLGAVVAPARETQPEALSSAERLIPSRQDATARAPEPARPSVGARLAPYAALAAACAAVVAVAAREPIADAAPPLGRVYAAMGLGAAGADAVVVNVTSEIASGEGGDVLLVEGEVVNRAATRTPTPALRVAVRDDRGVELYAWPAQSLKLSLEPGERTVFRARLASPPPAGRSVKVRVDSEAKGDARQPRAS